MDWTTVVIAVAGIAGTVLAPIITERMRREGVRQERLLTEGLEVYADLLRVTARLADNAMNWAAMPTAELEETDDAELDRTVSRVRVVASDEVLGWFLRLRKQVGEFNRLLVGEAQPHHRRVHQQGQADDDGTIRQRMALGELAEAIAESRRQIEAAIRNETRPGRGTAS